MFSLSLSEENSIALPIGLSAFLHDIAISSELYHFFFVFRIFLFSPFFNTFLFGSLVMGDIFFVLFCLR